MENHQGTNANGDPFDQWQYEWTDCVVDVEPGLYMYVQIDRELRNAATETELYFSGHEEFTRPLSAAGAYDLDWVQNGEPEWCVGPPPENVFVRAQPNPLTGVSDTHFTPVDLNNDELIKNADQRINGSEYDDGGFNHHLYSFGNARQGFRIGENSKLGIESFLGEHDEYTCL